MNQPGQTASASFGVVNARYFKILSTSSWDGSMHTVISEIYATQISGPAGCEATGQNNQVINFPEIPKKYTTDPPFELNATSSSGLPIDYSIVSGPATVSGNVVTLTGLGGTVIIKASQSGNSNYYPAEVERAFDVIDLGTIQPVIISRLTEDYPVQMSELMPYFLYASAEIDEPEVLNIEDTQFYADGELIPAEQGGNLYRALWTPSSFGNHKIEIRAIWSNGVSNSKNYTINVNNSISTQDVLTLDGAVIDMGTIGSQWYYGTYKLPQSVSTYDKILAEFDVTCPGVPGGCDD
ncbi:MAG: hypothetical protein WBF83_00595 [Moheibacter sp.]